MPDSPDSTLYDHYIVLYMEGMERRFEYEVAKETSERVREALEDEEIGNLIFEAYRPAEQIVLNSRFMQMARFEWRPRRDGNGGERPDERQETVCFYFAGRQEPIRLVAQDPEEIFDLVLAMETEAFPRASIVDAAGEEAVLDLRKLVCAEIPLGLAHRAETQALFEIGEEV